MCIEKLLNLQTERQINGSLLLKHSFSMNVQTKCKHTELTLFWSILECILDCVEYLHVNEAKYYGDIEAK